MIIRLISCGVLLAISLLGLPASWAAPVEKLRVAASITPYGDFCRQIGGERVDVQVLIPPGASPHTFEPSPGLLAGLRQAKVVVVNGADLEPWVTRFLRGLKTAKPFVVTATEGLDLIREVAGQEHGGKEAAHRPGKPAHDHAGVNPHVWLDPILAQDICRRIAAAFMQADPTGQTYYEQQLQSYLEKLANLHETIAAATAAFQIKEFIGFHPSFTYFARRYGLQEVGIIEVAPGREPTPRAFQDILAAIRRYGIRVVFSEPQFSPRIVEVLAKQAGVSVLTLDPLGGRPPYGDSYIKLMEYNLATMRQAMESR